MQVAVGCYQTCKCKSKSLLVEVNEMASDAVFSEKAVVTLFEAASRRSPWSRGLKRGSVTTRLLELRVRIPPGNGCLSFLSLSLVKGSPTDVACLSVLSEPQHRGAPGPLGLSKHEEEEEERSVIVRRLISRLAPAMISENFRDV